MADEILGSGSLGIRKIYNGASSYVFIRYSEFVDGKNMTEKPNEKTKYWGVYVSSKDVPSLKPNDYTWSLFKGSDGENSYTWVRYSINSNGNPMTTTPTIDTKYFGIAVTTSNSAPTDYALYTWALFKGKDGENGEDGKPSYAHKAWANSPFGTIDFTTDYPNENLLGNTLFAGTKNWQASHKAVLSISESYPDFDNKKVKNIFKIKQTAGNIHAFLSQNLQDQSNAKDKYKVGDNLTFSAWVYVPNTVPNVVFRIGKYDIINGNWTNSDFVSKSVRGDWAYISHTFKVTNLNTLVIVGLYQTANTSVEEFYVGGAKLELGSRSTIFMPSPKDDPINAYMKYVGDYSDFNELPSENPADYTWQRLQLDDAGFETLIVRQPTPPSKDDVYEGMLWMNTAARPNTTYRWGKSTDSSGETIMTWIPISAEEARDIPWITDENGTNLADWIYQVNVKTNPNSITQTVLGSQDFTGLYSGLAKLNDLDQYATSESMQQQYEEYLRLLNESIDGLNINQYVNKTDFEQTMREFNFNITQSGGINLIHNSVGYKMLNGNSSPNNKFDFWTIPDISYPNNVIQNTIDRNIIDLGYGSGFEFIGGNDVILEQEITLPVLGSQYTIGFDVYKRTLSSSDISAEVGIQIYDTNNNLIGNLVSPKEQILTSGFERYSMTFEPKVKNIILKIVKLSNNSISINGIITGLMLNIGVLPLQWQAHQSEIYSASVKMDQAGLTVLNNEYDGYTVMNPKEFAGYFKNNDNMYEKVFSLNKDTTLVKKLRAHESFTMEPMQLVSINTSELSGWAFIDFDETVDVPS